MTITPGKTQENVSKMESFIQNTSAAFPWVDMICFSEFSIPGFNPVTWREQAETIPGATTERFCEAAKANKKWLLPGSMFEKEDGKIYNSALVISPQGEITAKYRKMFPWAPLEPSTPGDKFCVFAIPNVGKFGLCICYDVGFPEVIRTLAWMGAEVVLHPAMTPTSLGPLMAVANRANALFNQCYVVSIDGVGLHGALTLAGHSMIVDPEGRVLQEMGESEALMIEILDLDNVTKAREYGTLGLVPFLKHLREYHHEFPVYKEIEKGEVYKTLSEVMVYDKIRPVHKD
jgi:predicted amidohydrolase